MANVTLPDLLTTCRSWLSQFSSLGRFTDQILIDNLNLAQQQVMLAVEWPEATWYCVADGTHSAFKLPEMDSLLRVYVNGQALPVSSKGILDGMLMGGPINDSGVNTPAWTAAPFTGYPMASGFGTPTTAGSLPYFIGGPPQYYPVQGGGAIGIAPPPAANSIIAIDCYPMPQPLSQNTPIEQHTFFPQMFREAIASRALMYCFFSMGGGGASQLQSISANYKDQIDNVLKPWKAKLFRSLPQPTMLPVPHRTYFRGPFRGPTGSGSRQGS